MIDYVAILTRRFFGKEWTLNGDDYAGIIWLSVFFVSTYIICSIPGKPNKNR